MLEKKIEKMKIQLNQMILTEPFDSQRLLSHSQALDRLIVDIMKRKANQRHKIASRVLQDKVDRDKSNNGSFANIPQLDRQQGYSYWPQQDDSFDRQQGHSFRPQQDDSYDQQPDNTIRRQRGDSRDRQQMKRVKQFKDDTLPSSNHENLKQMQQSKLLGHKQGDCLDFELIIAPIKIGL